MAIDSRNIDTDITLELDEEDITVSEFTSALDHFIGLVKEVTKRVAPRPRHEWLIKVYPGSAGIGLSGKPGTIAPSDIATIRQTILDGLSTLENGQRPSDFTDTAIEHAIGISRSFAKRQKPARIRIWNQNITSRPITRAIGDRASEILEPIYEDDGSVEGTLEVLSGHGTLRVVVYDPVDSRAIKCEISQKDLQTAIESFLHRVEVFGKVRYRSDGAPVSVRVEKIVPFPSPEEIPPLNELRGILRE